MKSLFAAATALSLGSSAYAAITYSPSGVQGVRYALSIPSSTASSGQGDIYFQIKASTQYEWVALGQGSGMAGSHIFVMYTSSDGQNVTVSPRTGTGHVEPQYDSSTRITLLEGSGVSNGQMTANVLCSNCASWNGGSMDFSSSSASWIYAVKTGSSLDSNSVSAGISQHDYSASFNWQLSQAKGGSASVNPFVSGSSSGGNSGGSGSGSGSGTSAGSGAASSSIPLSCTPIADSAGSTTAASTTAAPTSTTLLGPSGAGCPTTWPAQYSTAWPAYPPAWVTACYPNGPPGGRGSHPTSPPVAKPKQKRDDGCPAGYASTNDGSSSATLTNDGAVGLTASQFKWMPVAHGVLASLAFVAIFPIGGILVRIANFTGLVWVHAALQGVGFLVYIVAFAMGVYMANHLGMMSSAHPIIGTALFVVLLIQPIFGILHHKLFKKYGHRSIWSYLHLFHGRVAILLGMINGGLGIQLANTASMGARAAYGVVTAIMAILYIAAIFVGERRRKRKGPPNYEKSERAHRLRDLSSSEENFGSGRPYISNPRQQQEYYGGKGNRF